MTEENLPEVVVPPSFTLALSRDPDSVLQEAKRAAIALTSVISGIPKHKKVMINGEQYIEFDHWQLLARFYGCSVKVVKTEQVDFGDARGFLAQAVVLDSQGREISGAEAMCLNDEAYWSSRTKYEWIEGKKQVAGEVPVPANQLRSMAQTRACAKALRNVFSWVVVLAGYAPTPAEEMTGDEDTNAGKPPIKQPEAKTPAPDGDVISEAQGKRLFAIWKNAGKSNEDVAAYLHDQYGIGSTREIKKADYEAICTWAAKKTPETA